MRRVVISTDDVSEADRFAYWRAAGESAFGVDFEPSPSESAPFRGEFSIRTNGPLTFARAEADRFTARRGGRHLAARSTDAYAIYREMGDATAFRFARDEAATRLGLTLMADYDQRFEVEPRRGFNFGCLFVPRVMLEPHLPASGSHKPRSLSGLAGVEALASTFIDSVFAPFDSLPAGESARVSDTLCRLIGIACGARAGEHGEPIRVARLEEAKHYVDQHLANPGLTPERAAAALKMSVRQLHLLFEPSGTTFCQYVLSRRLEECRAALASPVGDRSVTDIALAWGFNCLATFFRTFRQAYGLTPCEWRRQASRPNQATQGILRRPR